MACNFTSFVNGSSVISERWENDNHRLCPMKPRLRLEEFSPPARIEPGTVRDQQASA